MHSEANRSSQRAAYLDGLYPDGHLRQAKVNTLPLAALGDFVREFALPALPGTLPKYDNENLECTFDDQIVGFGEGWGGADAVNFG